MKKAENILICGGGLMGKNIAFVASSVKNCRVHVYDIKEVDLEAGIRNSTGKLVEAGILSPEELEERLSRIRFTGDMNSEAVKNADLVIEAVFEDMELKRRTFAQLEANCSPECIFCTNTSVMSPTEISRDLRHKERFVGTHFWNPGHLIPLVEVVRTVHTSEETVETVMDFLQKAGKKPCLCNKDVPGFIANRLQHALWREAISIVENGIADPKTVDMAIKNSFGLRLPQLSALENADMVGLDLTYNIHKYVFPHIEDSHRVSPLLEKLVGEGKMGFKSGEGFYSWTDEEKAKCSEDLNAYLIKMLYF